MVGSMFAGCTDSSSDSDSDADTNTTETDGSGTSDSGSGSSSGSESGSSEKTESEGTGNGSTDSADGNNSGTENNEGTENTEGDNNDEEEDTTNGGTVKTTVYMVGDSTMCSFSDSYYLPRYGYGTQLENYLNSNVTINNLAISGKSSRDYLSQSNYTTLCNSIGEGDYLIIGFGHNDEKSGETFTDPNPDYKTQYSSNGDLSFQYNLYENYIKVALTAGATPILCTPIVRYDSSGSYTGERVHITDDGDYPEAIRTLGKDTNTTVIDLTAITKADYVSLGEDAQNYHAFAKTSSGVRDGLDKTHLNKYGAKMVAYELVTALKSTTNQLKHYVNSDITAPTYDTDYADAINTSYVELPYTAFDASNYSSNNLTGDWYSTVMGDANKVSNYTITQSNGTFTVGNTGGQGKFASAGDGFAAAFMQISVEKNFTATVTVKVTSISTSADKFNQSGFGMMLRDDIYVDTIQSSITSTFAAAGFIGKDSTLSNGSLSMYAGFSRESGSLNKTSNTVTISAESTYTLTIQRENQTVYITISDGTNSYKATYSDLNLYEIDSEYMYLCLFANRGITAEFSNFSITDDGTAQTA